MDATKKGLKVEYPPEYVRHISQHDPNNSKRVSYCGKDIGLDWAFQSADHAILERIRQGRLIPCQYCVKKITEILNS